MKKLITLCLVLAASSYWGQCTSTVSPTSQAVTCNLSPVASFTVSGVTPTLNIRHDWYSPYVNAYPILTANTVTSALSGSLAPGVYTVVTSYDNNACSVSKTFTITSVDAYPTFSLSSPTNYSLGCAPLNQTTLSIINPVSTQTPPATCSYTFVFPGGGTVNPIGQLAPNSATVTTIPGIWTVIVRDNSNFCSNVVTVPVIQNTITPNVGAALITRTLTCATPTILATGTTTTPNTYITWNVPSNPPNITSPTIVIGDPAYGPATSSVSLTYANFTVVATDIVNACMSTSVVPIYQNFKPPVSAPMISIATPTVIDCNTPGQAVILTTGNSTTTSGGGPLAYITNPCWDGPAPQTSTCGPASYSCFVPGVYSLTVTDNYNGCSNTGTIVVTSVNGATLTAGFSHTVWPGGAVDFSNTSVGTTSNTTYSWNFGDGYTSTSSSPSHTYITDGSYPVVFIVNNGPGCAGGTSSVTQYVNITGVTCTANAIFNLVPTNTAQVWNAIPVYPYNIVSAQWNWGDGNTSNVLYGSHSYMGPGTYTICFSATVSCLDASTYCLSQYLSRSVSPDNAIVSVNVVPPAAVGLPETQAEALLYSVYPNPANGKFELSTFSQDDVTLKIFNTIGSEVFRKTFHSNGVLNETVDAGNLPIGIYFISLQSGNKSSVKKLVISK